MTDKLRVAAQAALEALEISYMNGSAGLHKFELNEIGGAIEKLRAALADVEDDAWEVDYEVRVATGDEDMWVAGASDAKEALHYAAQYVEEGTVRVYERRMKVLATLEASHD